MESKHHENSEGDEVVSDDDGPFGLMVAHKKQLQDKVQASKKCFSKQFSTGNLGHYPVPAPINGICARSSEYIQGKNLSSIREMPNSLPNRINAPIPPPSPKEERKRRGSSLVNERSKAEGQRHAAPVEEEKEKAVTVYKRNSIMIRQIQDPRGEPNQLSRKRSSITKKPQKKPKKETIEEQKRKEMIKKFLIKGEYDSGKIKEIRNNILDKNRTFDDFIKGGKTSEVRQGIQFKKSSKSPNKKK